MNASRKYAVMILAVMFALCAVCAYADQYEEEDFIFGGVGSDPFASRVNVEINMDGNPPSAHGYRYKYWDKTFRKDGKYWVINELPKGTILTVPEGCKARCVSFHTEAVKGGKGKTLDNGRVIYSAGTTVKYMYPSFLQLYKD